MDDKVAANRQVKGEENGKAKLTESYVFDIRSRYVPGVVTMQMLANEYDVHQTTICQIVTGKTWTHV